MDGSSLSQDERSDPLSVLTRQYRESVLRLTSTCDESVSWQTSQCFLDKLWEDNEKAHCQQAVIYGCQTCGSLIHPGYMSTGLHVTRGKKASQSRTLRRREQRKQRKEALAQQKQASDVNRRKDSQALKAGIKMLLLEDDRSVTRDRHHLVIKCGRCRSTVRCKGIKREAPEPKPPPQAMQANAQSKTEKDNKSWNPKDGESDFVKLPAPANPLLSLLQQKERRKKKKEKPPPKTNLMSFLNTLND
jgi:hypothetical protein